MFISVWAMCEGKNAQPVCPDVHFLQSFFPSDIQQASPVCEKLLPPLCVLLPLEKNMVHVSVEQTVHLLKK